MKQVYKSALLLLLLLGVITTVNAQKMSVTGKISDNSGSLPGVSIIIKGSKIGTESDFDGMYKIAAVSGDVLVFRYLGYKAIEKTVGTSNVINLTYD